MISFLICGFARSGTTHLSKWLNSHSEIRVYDPLASEPKFFSRNENYSHGKSWYEKNYFRDHEGVIAGEKSTEYSESKDFVDRLQATYPDMKLIFMIRNPVDRLLSNYEWSKKNGFETREINDALEAEWQKGIEINGKVETNQTRPFCYLGRSIYSSILKEVYGKLPTQQVLLVDFDHYTSGRVKTLQTIGRFLGFEASLDEHKNTSHADRKTNKKSEVIDQKFLVYLMQDYEQVKSSYDLI